MTVAVTRTKAEQAFTENFEAVAAKLPGGRTVEAARKAAIGAFAALGLPHRRIEEWKYTDLRSALKEALPPIVADETSVTAAQIEEALGPLRRLDATLLVFVNGRYRRELSAIKLARGVETSSLAGALAGNYESLDHDSAPTGDALVALNTAFATDGVVIRVAEGIELARPLLVLFVRAGKTAGLVTTRNRVELGAGARATLIEAFVTLDGGAAGQANALSEITLGAGAHLAHVNCTLGDDNDVHLSTVLVRLATGADYRTFELTTGVGLARHNVFATFAGEGGKLDFSGCFLGSGRQHVDTTLCIDHAVPACKSRELFKCVLADRARGVFQGKVVVRPDAQKTDGKQMAQALMLSQDAEFDSKPELEIHADDVICGHGSTAAEIDEDLLFYLRARGIPAPEARALLIESFIGEALDKVEDENLRTALTGIAHRGLSALAT